MTGQQVREQDDYMQIGLDALVRLMDSGADVSDLLILAAMAGILTEFKQTLKAKTKSEDEN